MKLEARLVSLLLILLLAGSSIAGEPDWFTRVKRDGIEAACGIYVARHESGVEPDSLHVGRCYFLLGRYEEGIAVYARLTRSPDRNYAAAALARMGEGYFHLGRREDAREAFRQCIDRYPEAWLDGSVLEFCRAWIRKLDGSLRIRESRPVSPQVSVEDVRREVEALEKRLRELRELMERMSSGD